MEVLMFQSPSLRGSGRFALLLVWPPYADPMVSIPFIAGQWSLRDREDVSGRAPGAFQSPSLRGSGRFRLLLDALETALSGFNPLHCGAVVASPAQGSSNQAPCGFQSPSLRGSGRFMLTPNWYCVNHLKFQSPSLRGSGRFAAHL